MRFVVSSLIALGFVAAANAGTIEQVNVEITYNKTDLETSEGAKSVLTKIEREARRDCRVGGTYTRILKGGLDEACYAEIVAKAIAKIDAPQLTSVYLKDLDQ